MAALNAEIPEELKSQVEHTRIDRGMTLKAAVAEALQNWVSPQAERPEAPANSEALEIPEKYAALVGEFLRLLDDKDPKSAHWRKGFSEILELRMARRREAEEK
jgi:hypothetical protein